MVLQQEPRLEGEAPRPGRLQPDHARQARLRDLLHLWRTGRGSNVSSPVYHDGHLYWASDNSGVVYCQEAATGKVVYQRRLTPASGLIYASPVLAGGKLYYVSQRKGANVVAAKPEFELLAHNVFEGDDSRANASPAVSSAFPPGRRPPRRTCRRRPRAPS